MIYADPMAQNGSVPLRYALRRITRVYGKGYQRGFCRRLARIIARSFMTGPSPSSMKDARSPFLAKSWEKMTLPRSRMDCPGLKTACLCYGQLACVPERSLQINSLLITAQIPRRFLVYIPIRVLY